MPKWIIAIVLPLTFRSLLFAQTDTLTVMHYNLLNYRATTSQCDATTNDPAKKEQYLNTIVSYLRPDVITVNEMGANWLNPNRLLVNALNSNGRNYYAQVEFTSNGTSNIANMLFFNTRKLRLKEQSDISRDGNGGNLIRSIDRYLLYFNDSIGLIAGDTTWLTVYCAHLKAGSTTSDKAQRAEQTAALMGDLRSRPPSNYILCGDFNTQSSVEQSYVNLTADIGDKRQFIDVVNAPGIWHDKKLFANLHTQSTRLSNTSGGCFAGGGMDDRFDFILCTEPIMNNTKSVKYIPSSYNTLGQDALHFNAEIIGNNRSDPDSVINALYNLSDHLPVALKLQISRKNLHVEEGEIQNFAIPNPVSGYIPLSASHHLAEVNIYDMTGRLLRSVPIHRDLTEIDASDLKAGMYILEAISNNKSRITRRIIMR